MDDFAAPATWDGGGSESVVIKFNAAKMSPEQLEQLAGFQGRSEPVTMEFPGCHARQAMIVGFGNKDNTVYITWL
ncbi:hypothetical protein [Anatilimnocola floriformis]|uniref:hypothetical protein n=1 Tax=Anatilimnocola floriformis TaxID=2948575 RepID=UPI0020C3C70B|nr:hypothetical protein [Anatilimnocola floriformis]